MSPSHSPSSPASAIGYTVGRGLILAVPWPEVAAAFGLYLGLTLGVLFIEAPAVQAACTSLSHVLLVSLALWFNLRRAQERPDEATAWRLLALAGAVVIVFESALAFEQLYPDALHIPPAGWLVQTILSNGALLAGLLALPFGGRTAESRLRTGLDGVAFSIAAFLLLWLSGLRAELADSAAPALVRAEAIFSYAANTASLGVVVYLGARSHRRFNGSLGWFALAMVLLSSGTALVLYGRLHGTFALGSFPVLLQLAAYPCYIIAPRARRATADNLQRDEGSLLGDALTYAPVLVAIALGVSSTVTSRDGDPLLALGVPLLAAIVLARQALALRDVRDLSATLEARVASRTLELERSQQALVSAQRMEAIGLLAGGVAHDVNNMLSVVRSSADMLADLIPADSPAREDVDAILSASDSGSRMARALLTFAGRPSAAPLAGVADVHATIHGMQWLTRTLGPANIAYREPRGDWEARVSTSVSQLEQLLSNLISNAKDAMPAGGVLEVSTARVTLTESALPIGGASRAGDFICISVHDTGTGIPPAILPRVFEPFLTTKGTGKGTGLGLATCYAIARDAGGFIGVESTPSGTRFEVLLPVAP